MPTSFGELKKRAYFQVHDRCRSPGRVGGCGRERYHRTYAHTRAHARARVRGQHETGTDHGGHRHDDVRTQEDGVQAREGRISARNRGNTRGRVVQHRRSDRGRYARTARGAHRAQKVDRIHRRQTQVHQPEEGAEGDPDRGRGHRAGRHRRRRRRRSRVHRVRHLRVDSVRQVLPGQEPLPVRLATGHHHRLRFGRA